jgi:intracellular multiplication protein IcmO
MAIYEKFEMPFHSKFRDVRPAGERIAESMGTPSTIGNVFFGLALALIFLPLTGARFILAWVDVVALLAAAYMYWFNKQPIKLPFKMPAYAHMKDPKNPVPGKDGVAGNSEGILFLGNERDPKTNKELWLTNSDARTHILFLGTTGTGKTEGLKSLVSNALVWGSGFIYVDGKADTDLWANLYSLARRFGRDDDMLVLNYMTGNSDDGSTSNTFNPFATGSSSYLSNMLTNLMPDAGGDNAMWKERAVALMFALMPALTFMRDKKGLLLDISVVRDHIELKPIVRLSRNSELPERIIRGLQGYLATLPGYVDDAFDDDGNEKPPSPDAPMYDLQIARQQHGYLSMQFTRAMQSLGDEYGYIFRAQLADVDVIDVVLQRRILIGLIPSLEKSGDEAANLGKIIAATIKGMMGATLGATVEGTWEDAIESKATRASSPYMTVFDEVGYYVAQGMAVMAAQARSLGFSLIFAAQDLPAMEKRVKQEAQSILGNCNLKIFGKLEDPLESKKFFEEHVGTSWVYETQGFNAPTNLLSSFFVSNPYIDNRSSTTVVLRPRAAYDHLRKQREGQVHMLFHEFLVVAQIYHAEPRRVTALRVQKMLPVPSTTTTTAARERMIADLSRKLEDEEWVAAKAMSPAQTPEEVKALSEGFEAALKAKLDPVKAGVAALASITGLAEKASVEEKTHGSGTGRVVIENEDEMLETRAPAAPPSTAARPSQRMMDAPLPEEDYGEPQSGVTPSGFEESFDYRPRTASRLSKMGVGVEDVAAIKPEDVSVLSQDADIGKLKDLPPEAVDELKKGARNLSDALFSETPPDGE